jgi:flagellar motor switch protein FliN
MAVGRGGDPLDQADIDAAIAAAQAAMPTPEPPASLPPEPAHAIFAPLDEPEAPLGSEAQNLDIVMDIPLEVSVELGRKRMSIRDILDLGSGSIVELDKIAGEPVDLLVNGRLVARGEVVVIEDNFGVRITEIVGSAARGGAGEGGR